jgi:hypothetical protein
MSNTNPAGVAIPNDPPPPDPNAPPTAPPASPDDAEDATIASLVDALKQGHKDCRNSHRALLGAIAAVDAARAEHDRDENALAETIARIHELVPDADTPAAPKAPATPGQS